MTTKLGGFEDDVIADANRLANGTDLVARHDAKVAARVALAIERHRHAVVLEFGCFVGARLDERIRKGMAQLNDLTVDNGLATLTALLENVVLVVLFSLRLERENVVLEHFD